MHIHYLNSNFQRSPAVDATTKATYILHYNCIWITCCRKKIIGGDVGGAIQKILTEALTKEGIELISLDIFDDRLHMTVSVLPEHDLFVFMPRLKRIVSDRIRGLFKEIDRELAGAALWQEGHYISTVGKKSEEELLRYVKDINNLTDSTTG